ncbi:MAG TPA: DNA-binding response regulator [Herpetosiphon sp.]|uniref:Two component transcriptional regulator, winged helix family n=2 Tax=Herpetosiphon TaxID=64 RepID=A9AWW7_HERA2|nr:response regulator transcription factor [Herpetosiphon sp.]ABX03368.1 two component transcriptional regulator, winged helix family [Herpetosiphon aurantiacus DSM 785]MCA0352107.1 response regulator transcription factor [Chloroflexota bacterium]HBW50523.1 DNA-binding response regulator [Herpetosiphon sp.]
MPARWRILVVDDDTIIRRTLVSNLLNDGFEVMAAESGQSALTMVESSWPDLAILDLMMPGMTGFELSDRLRRYVEIPVIMLTSISDEATTVRGLEQHADDYMTKPYRYPELRARVNKLLTKSYEGGLHPGELVVIDEDLSVNFGQHILLRKGEAIPLEPIELRVLYLLLQTPTVAVATTTLLRKAWGLGEEGDQSSLWVRIRSLRTKLEDNPSKPIYLKTVRGVGYVFDVQPRRGL